MMSYSLYRSTASRNLQASDLEDILRTARARNLDLGVTGCLHYESGLFFQWLEGAAESVDAVLGSIKKDPRHRDVVILISGRQEQRRFSGWKMRFSDSSNASLLDWLASAEVATLDRRNYADGVMTFLQSVAA